MATKKTCPACGAPVSPGEEFCSYCGALIPHNVASAAAVQAAPAPAEQPRAKRGVETPRTVDELLAFCERHQLPLAKMRFFIGLDYPGARAYGIFQDKNGDFVVYKNKADGSRAVRYRGPDEAYAVKELFDKLKEEASQQRARVAAARSGTGGTTVPPQKSAPGGSSAGSVRAGGRKSNKLLIALLVAAAVITIGRAAAHSRPQHITPGYYQYNGNTYYSSNDDWYYYDTFNGDWFPIYDLDDDFANHYSDYYSSYSYDSDYGVSDFSDSQYYSYDADSSDYSDSSGSWSWDWDDDDSWDSSDDWDWDSDWDSDWSDWDSDW